MYLSQQLPLFEVREDREGEGPTSDRRFGSLFIGDSRTHNIHLRLDFKG